MSPATASPAADLPLRDIHLPDPIGSWPPAPGWWMLALLILLISGLLIFWFRKNQHRWKMHRDINHQFEQIEMRYRNKPDGLLLANALSSLLRRIAISTTSREHSAGLIGQAWLEYLDTGINSTGFSTGAGRCLIEAPYNPNTSVDGVALLQLCRQWIDGCKAIKAP